MIKVELAPGMCVYKNVIEEHESIIKDLEDSIELKTLSWQQAYVRSAQSDELDTNTRDTLTIGVPYSANPEIDMSSPSQAILSGLSKLFFDSFNPLETEYKQSYSVGTESHDVYGILKYGVGQKFTNHIDDHTVYPRRVSTVYYLNDDYEGGEINFPRFNISYKPAANELLIFPSNYIYNHSVSEVTSGTRYAVVSWLT
jgi:hypothetical protein